MATEEGGIQNHLSAVDINPGLGASEIAHELDLTTTFQTNVSALVPVPGLSETFTTHGGSVRLSADLTALIQENFGGAIAQLRLDGVAVGPAQPSGSDGWDWAPQYTTFDLETYLPTVPAGTHTVDVQLFATNGHPISLPSTVLNHVSAVEFRTAPVATVINGGRTVVTPVQAWPA